MTNRFDKRTAHELKGIVLTKDAAFGGRGSWGVGPAHRHRATSLLTGPDRAEVDRHKVFLFPGTQRLLLLEKDRCRGRGGGVGMRTSAEIPQAERSIHGTTMYIYK